MTIFRLLLSAALVLFLTACGGGGGSPGSTSNSGGDGSSSPVLTGGTVALDLVTEDGTVVKDKKLSQTTALFLRATVKNSAGSMVDQARVIFEVDSPDAVLVPVSGVALTRSGIATIKVAPASVGSQGVVTAKTSVTLNGTTITAEIFLDISPGIVALKNIKVIPNKVQKGQSITTSVEVFINDSVAPSNAVGIVFGSTCGTVSPAVSLVDASGKATAVVQTNAVGDCTVSASYNAVSATGSFQVTASPITGIKFLSASPSTVYQAGSTAVKTSIVAFQVIDSLGGGVPSIPVSASLTNTDGGINFCGSPYESVNSDANGIVSFSVCSGTLPATVQVRASIDSSTGIYTDSNLLTIQTGLPTQRFFDISATALNYYVGGYFTSKFNGNEVSITVFAADRQGNPVPPGTPIIFVAEGGQIVSSGLSSCLIGDNGRCTVKLVGQDYRPLGSMDLYGADLGDPRPGRVTVLAYADGEEYFVDSNFNNRYDLDELFEDLGQPFMDKNENKQFDITYKNRVMNTDDGEFKYPILNSAIGGELCPDNSSVGLSVQKTCNKKWDGQTKVRRQIVIVFSGAEIGDSGSFETIENTTSFTTSLLGNSRQSIVLKVVNATGDSLPKTVVPTVSVLDDDSGCTAAISAPGSVDYQISLKNCVGDERIQFQFFEGSNSSSSVINVSGYDATIPVSKRTAVLSSSRSGILVRVADYNGNPLPAVAALSTEVLKISGDCTARLVGNIVGNTTEPTVHQIILEKCNGGETVLFKSTVQNKESIFSIAVP